MYVQHPHTQACGRGAGARDGIGDIVKLQVEKDIESAVNQLADQPRAGTREQLAADLELARAGVNFADKTERFFAAAVIKRNDQPGSFNGAQGRSPSAILKKSSNTYSSRTGLIVLQELQLGQSQCKALPLNPHCWQA